MKTKNYIYLFSLVLFFLLISCQTDSSEESYSTNETITKTTPLVSYIQRISMPSTSGDDFIDKSNCFKIDFPFVVTVNNKYFNINSADDYKLVKAIIEVNSNGDDLVFIQYPIIITFNNYSKRILYSQIELNNLDCDANSLLFGKINCLTINFPITISSYNSSNQIAGSTSIANNQLLFTFLDKLSSDKYIAIDYPITITNGSNQLVTVLNNNQLEDLVKTAVASCSENFNTPLDFTKILTSSSWKISYYFEDKNRTSNFDGYVFIFNSDYKVIATKNNISFYGNWELKKEDNGTEFKMKFEVDPLNKLDEDWEIFEFNNLQLRFRNQDDANENDYLYLEKK